MPQNMSDHSPSDDELGSAVNVTYTPRVIKFIDCGGQDALQSMLCKRRMKFDVARTPMLDCLYDADGSALLRELIKAGHALPVHPWETADMRAFRMRGDLESVQLADVISWHAKFRFILIANSVFEIDDLTDEQLELTRCTIGNQDARLPRYSEKVGEWVGSVAHFLEAVDWGINDLEPSLRDELRRLVLEGGHVGKPCLQLCEYWSRQRWHPAGVLFVNTVTDALDLVDRTKRHWAKARVAITACVAIVSFWRRAAAEPDSKAAKAAIARVAKRARLHQLPPPAPSPPPFGSPSEPGDSTTGPPF